MLLSLAKQVDQPQNIHALFQGTAECVPLLPKAQAGSLADSLILIPRAQGKPRGSARVDPSIANGLGGGADLAALQLLKPTNYSSCTFLLIQSQARSAAQDTEGQVRPED